MPTSSNPWPSRGLAAEAVWISAPGFYVHVWGFCIQTQDSKYAGWRLKMIDHHWRFRDAQEFAEHNARQRAQIAPRNRLSASAEFVETAASCPMEI
jgi:hypothetical protein